jgi:Tfp pilus assembly protein PilO
MKYTTRRNISLFIAGVLLIASISVFFGLDWPVLREIRELSSKLAQERVQYEEQFQAVQTAKSIINQYKTLTGVSQAISLSVPRGPEIQNVISQLDNLAVQSGLDVQNISFETPAVSSLGEQRGGIALENRILVVSLALSGSYQSFKTWLNAIESNIRLMDVKNISFSSFGGGVIDQFNFKVVLTSYYQ